MDSQNVAYGISHDIASQVAGIYGDAKVQIDEKINYGTAFDKKLYGLIRDIADGKYTQK